MNTYNLIQIALHYSHSYKHHTLNCNNNYFSFWM